MLVFVLLLSASLLFLVADPVKIQARIVALLSLQIQVSLNVFQLHENYYKEKQLYKQYLIVYWGSYQSKIM